MVEKLGNLPAEASLDGLTVLAIRDYSLNYNTTSGPFEALKSINLEINRGQTLGLVGESGSGKTSLAWAIMRYLPDNASEVSGSISLLGENLRGKSHQEILEIRGRRISMVFQDPSTSLNPVIRLGDQIVISNQRMVQNCGLRFRVLKNSLGGTVADQVYQPRGKARQVRPLDAQWPGRIHKHLRHPFKNIRSRRRYAGRQSDRPGIPE